MQSKFRSPRVPWIWASAIPLLLLAIIVTLDSWAQPPPAHTLKPKIFVLGLSKTGTTSIGDALERLGYRRIGWRDIRSRHMVHTFVNGDMESLIELTRYYEAFEDLPWPLLYRQMADIYPDAKFILSMRKNEQTWLRSMRTHMGRGKWLPYETFYGADTMDGNEGVILESYLNHTDQVRDYFADKPHRYAELNIDDGDMNWNILCQIAQCPHGSAPSVGFPRSNTVASWDVGWLRNNLQWWWGWLVTRMEELTAYYYYASGRTLLKRPLNLAWSIIDLTDRVINEVYFRYYTPALTKL